MEINYQSGETVRIERKNDHYVVTIGDRTFDVTLSHSAPGELTFSFDNHSRRAYFSVDGPTCSVALDATVYTFTTTENRRRMVGGGENNLTATMPGQVVKVLVAEGESVVRGQPLVVLEAMKMEIRVSAPHDGRIHKLLCSPGQVVDRGQALLELASL